MQKFVNLGTPRFRVVGGINMRLCDVLWCERLATQVRTDARGEIRLCEHDARLYDANAGPKIEVVPG